MDCNRYLLTAGQRDLEASSLVKRKEQDCAQCSTERNVRRTVPLAFFSEDLYDIWSKGTFVHYYVMKKCTRGVELWLHSFTTNGDLSPGKHRQSPLVNALQDEKKRRAENTFQIITRLFHSNYIFNPLPANVENIVNSE